MLAALGLGWRYKERLARAASPLVTRVTTAVAGLIPDPTPDPTDAPGPPGDPTRVAATPPTPRATAAPPPPAPIPVDPSPDPTADPLGLDEPGLLDRVRGVFDWARDGLKAGLDKGKRVLAGLRGGDPDSPDAPPDGPAGPTGATADPTGGRGGGAARDGAPVTPRVEVAGAEGQPRSVPGGPRFDFHPGARYRVRGPAVTLLAGGAAIRFPPGGATVTLPGGRALAGRDAVVEVHRVEDDGLVDVARGGVELVSPRGRRRLRPMQRVYLEGEQAAAIPAVEADTFVRRLAWFASYPRRDRAAGLAVSMAQDALESARGTPREAAALAAMDAAISWDRRVAARRRRAGMARL